MKVNILYNYKERPWGGANQFLKALRNEFVSKGYYEKDPYKADIIIFNQFPFNNEDIFFKLFKLKKLGKKIVHRIDGPIYLAKNCGTYDLLLDKFQFWFNNLFAEGTIFQSQYSMKENKNLGMKDNDFEIILYNAPDKKIFNRIGKSNKIELGEKVKILITTWSPHKNKGFEVYKWLDDNLDFNKYEVNFIGNSKVYFKNINDLGPMSSNSIADYLKRSDIFFTASINEGCSNSVIEALHSGLPTISKYNSSHPELIKGGGGYYNKLFEIPDLLDKISNDYDKYQKRIKVDNIETISKYYYDFLLKVYNKSKLKKVNNIKFYSFISIIYFIKLYRLFTSKISLLLGKIKRINNIIYILKLK